MEEDISTIRIIIEVIIDTHIKASIDFSMRDILFVFGLEFHIKLFFISISVVFSVGKRRESVIDSM